MNNLTNEESKKDQYMFIKMIHDINKIFVGHSLTSKLVNKYIYIYIKISRPIQTGYALEK